MTFHVGDRITILQPSWNKTIWGYAGTIEGIDLDARLAPHYTVLLDNPNTITHNADRYHVYPGPNEMQLTPRGTSSHTAWSPK